jgi:hypothetical protein
MEHYAGIDVSLELSSVCVVDAKGAIIREAKVTSEPDALVGFLRGLGVSIERVGLEAGPLSQWLHAGLTEAGFETALLETRHVKAALSAMTVKTDRKDARGIAQLLRMGWYRPVHCKSPGAREIRALLVARKLLLGKLLNVEFSIRGLLRGFGLKMGVVIRRGFEARVRELCSGLALLSGIMEAMLAARAELQAQFGKLHKSMLPIVRADSVCRRLMSAPGVALPFESCARYRITSDSSDSTSSWIGSYASRPRVKLGGQALSVGDVSRVQAVSAGLMPTVRIWSRSFTTCARNASCASSSGVNISVIANKALARRMALRPQLWPVRTSWAARGSRMSYARP